MSHPGLLLLPAIKLSFRLSKCCGAPRREHFLMLRQRLTPPSCAARVAARSPRHRIPVEQIDRTAGSPAFPLPRSPAPSAARCSSCVGQRFRLDAQRAAGELLQRFGQRGFAHRNVERCRLAPQLDADGRARIARFGLRSRRPGRRGDALGKGGRGARRRLSPAAGAGNGTTTVSSSASAGAVRAVLLLAWPGASSSRSR